MRRFVTGTDTDVGKTVITACLADALRDEGHAVCAVKPVASGVVPGTWGDDATLLGEAAGHEPRVFARFEAPVSPHRAAALEGRRLDVVGLLDWLDAHTTEDLLVEGVGGWRVPLVVDPLFDVAALARHVGAPIVIVAADRLGVLSHTLLTVAAVRGSGLAVAGVVLNPTAETDASTPSNLDDLRSLLDVPVVAATRIEPTDRPQRIRLGRALLRGMA